MAKQGTKEIPARKPAVSDDDSLLIRSAESLGRVIGSLQRQMQGTTKRMSQAAEDAMDALPDVPQFDEMLNAAREATGVGVGTRKAAGGRKRTSGSAGGTRKSAGTRKAT